MPEYKDGQPIRDKVSMVLRGPDGKVKETREVDYAPAADTVKGMTFAEGLLTDVATLVENYKSIQTQEADDDRSD